MNRYVAQANFSTPTKPFLLALLYLAMVLVAGPVLAAESLDQLYEKAKREGGNLTLYAPLSARTMEVILPAFMKRFPGVTVNHIDSTSDKLIARVLTELRGGRVLADVISGALTYIPQMLDQKFLAPLTIPEAAVYPDQMKGEYWVATDTQYYIAGWNTGLVKKRRGAEKLRGSGKPQVEGPSDGRAAGLSVARRIRED
jgi:ABC-type glycerol-3-phosphate transport system substrate-binding protein